MTTNGDYLSAAQVDQLLKPINSARVGKDPKGFSYLEQYDVRAHLNRIFGFARWSADLMSMDLIFEDEATGKDAKLRTTVGYRAVMRLLVKAPDGTPLATYTEGAVGAATNQPNRADAHDLAVKTAESQALKRCAINLGDQFGISLYSGGSKAALVKKVLVMPEGETDDTPVDDGIEPVVPDAETPSTVETEPAAVSVRSPEDTVKEIAAKIAAIPVKASPRARQVALARIKLDYRAFLYVTWSDGVTVNDHIDGLISAAKLDQEVTP